MRKAFLILLVVLLLSAACVFALSGTGNYAYEVENGEPDSTDAVLEVLDAGDPRADPLTDPLDSLDENADDDFDLLECDCSQKGSKTWPE